MDLLSRKKHIYKDKLFLILHHGLRIFPGIGAFVLIVLFDLPFMAYALVAVSKWRILSFRFRVLLSNLQINMVDLLVILSLVYFMTAELLLWQQLIWLGVYLLWVLVIKSISDKKYGHLLQGLLAQAFSCSIIIYNLHRLEVLVALLAIFIVSSLSAKHVFNGLETQRYHKSLVYVWGLFSLQLAWVLLHWQTNFWFIPQYVFLQTVILGSGVVLYIFYQDGRLSNFFKKQIIVSVLAVVIIALIISHLHQII